MDKLTLRLFYDTQCDEVMGYVNTILNNYGSNLQFLDVTPENSDYEEYQLFEEHIP